MLLPKQTGMKYSLAILFSFCCVFTRAQHAATSSDGMTIFRLYLSYRYNDAIKYYDSVQQVKPGPANSYICHQIGNCYLQLKDTSNAVKYFLQSLSSGRVKDSLFSSQSQACYTLHQVYYNQRKFDLALLYLNYSQKEFAPTRRLCMGGYGFESLLLLNHRRFECYYALGRKDSAVTVLAPSVFAPASYRFLNPAKYRDISKQFVGACFELYGKRKVQQELDCAMQNAFYKVAYEKHANNLIMANVDCGFTLSGAVVHLYEGGYQVQKEGEIPECISKETWIAEAKQSYSYPVDYGRIFTANTMIEIIQQ